MRKTPILGTFVTECSLKDEQLFHMPNILWYGKGPRSFYIEFTAHDIQRDIIINLYAFTMHTINGMLQKPLLHVLPIDNVICLPYIHIHIS